MEHPSKVYEVRRFRNDPGPPAPRAPASYPLPELRKAVGGLGMSGEAMSSHDPAAEIVFGEELADLEAIFEPHVQLATAPIRLGQEIAEHVREGRVGWSWKQFVGVDEDHQPDLNRLRSLQVGTAPGGEALRAATAEVLEVVALLFNAEGLGVRVVNATRPPCPRYHVDRVAVRGVLTLVGRGSDYLLAHQVDRTKLGHGAGGLPDEASGLIVPGAEPRHLEAGLVCLFKGEDWPSNAGKGLVHRSPPEDGNPRWILTVDLVAA